MTYQYNHVIGIDISKNRLDVCLLKKLEKEICFQVKNHQQGLKKINSTLQKRRIEPAKTLICAEYTGLYTNPLANFCTENNWNLSLQSGMQIKKSLGIQRGKNDKVDAERIALYAFRFLKTWEDTQYRIYGKVPPYQSLPPYQWHRERIGLV